MGSGDRSKLVKICDRAGRPRGTGFVADDRGTVVTSHRAVASDAPLVLHGSDGRTCPVGPDDITALPALGLALVRTGGPEALGTEPLPIAARDRIEAGTYVRIAAHGWREARVLGTAPATYTEGGRGHPVGAALELALGTDGRDALRSGGAAVGGPVTDPRTGAVLGVLCTALRAAHEAAGLALPLAPGSGGEFDALLRRNAMSVPGYGPDLNLAGALQLTATSVGSAGGTGARTERVERDGVQAEFTAFEDGTGTVLGLVGAPGTGRTTELAALAARRAGGEAPALTLWLRGADLLADDTSVAEAVARTLARSARIVTAAGARGDMGTATPERVAALAAAAGHPLLVVLDGPEEMPPLLAHRLAEWTAGTADWLRHHGARLVVACRPEHWERAGSFHPPDTLHRPVRPARGLPPALRLGDLTASEAERARERYGIPAGALAPGHDRHPLTLRLLAEVRAALPPDVAGRPDTEDVFGAHLDLMCVRVAVRIAAAADPQPRGTAVRRLAARVAGQVHEAARRCLGPGQGELDRAAFEEIFPWRTGWASAVLTEGLLVPAGAGYRFAHEELGDWVQGAHLDLDAALRSLVHRWHTGEERTVAAVPAASLTASAGPVVPVAPVAPVAPVVSGRGSLPRPRRSRQPQPRQQSQQPRSLQRFGESRESRESESVGSAQQLHRPPLIQVPHQPHQPQALHESPETLEPRSLPVPRHRIGPVIQAMLLLGRRQGTSALAHRMADLIEALDRLSRDDGRTRADEDAGWWAAHLLGQSLLEVPDARPYLGVLRVLAGRITRRSAAGAGPAGLGAYTEFGPWFWRRLRLPEEDRIDLLRRLVPADGIPRADGDERYLDAVARRLALDPPTVQRLLCRWFTDERPLPAGQDVPLRPTVAAAAQALLYARRDLAVDELTDALVVTPHPRAAELLAALAEDEPAALCRAVERWARDEDRPARRPAAAHYAALLAERTLADIDRALLRAAALALLARRSDGDLHGPALTLLVRDPETRDRHIAEALRVFAAGDPRLPVALLAEVFPARPEPVLAALRARLVRTGDGAGEVLRELAALDAPALALHAAGLVRAYIDSHPDDGTYAGEYVDLRLEHGPAARALLLPLVTGLLRNRPVPPVVRGALARVLAGPGSTASRPLRAELLEVLLEFEQDRGRDAEVLDALLRAAATGSGHRPEVRTRALVHRTGMLLVRTPEGAARFDRSLVELARDVPGFAALVIGWLADAPQEWAAVVGPSARRTVEALEASRPAIPMPMQAAGREHGSLRPA
ncbi:serine protease [Streptomyces sp. NBC_01433]|uniref:trypsin-like peptidase domain-containing protein n=1 Tax=Streptomyces sp. NBC_01433 TaxID=2903864 RepID=UPI00225C28CD|nr:trypsin-like peptidase domain-containing protein [Streptomyces sp. NBC_01433]MCX4673880.1 serine protease [Streptomyces sp. NBC_01433]